MNDLIAVSVNEKDEHVVSGRTLHGFLEIDSNYTTWFKRMCEYGFSEEQDYVPILENRSDGFPGKPRTDHAIKIDMAKELCMLARSDKGKQARQYFIQLEKDWNSPEKVLERARKTGRYKALRQDVDPELKRIREYRLLVGNKNIPAEQKTILLNMMFKQITGDDAPKTASPAEKVINLMVDRGILKAGNVKESQIRLFTKEFLKA